MQNFLVIGMLSHDALHLRRPDESLRISVCPGILAQFPQDQVGSSTSPTTSTVVLVIVVVGSSSSAG